MAILKHLERPLVFFFTIAVLVFSLQPYKVGFEKGHHGWVSSHTLSEIIHAKPENRFLGYALKIKKENGIDFEYFDRYPVVFAGLSNLILSPFENQVAAYIYFARQWMNLIFLISLWLVWRILRQLVNEHANSITLLVASSSMLLKYKDMVHFDQPALVGCLWALNGIIDFEKNGKQRWLYTAVIFGPLLGRGYAVVFFLGAWALIRFARKFWLARDFKLAFKSIPFKFCFMSVPLPMLMLAFNILGEAHVRNIHWRETSIVVSAEHRLSFKSYKTSSDEKKFSWPSFVNNQVQRTLDYMTPYGLFGMHVKNHKQPVTHYLTLIPKFIFQIFLIVMLWKYFKGFWRARSELEKLLYLILSGSGLLWILVMRNLANYHDYVTMYLIGLVIVFWIFMVELMKERKWNVTIIATAIFSISVALNFGVNQRIASKVNWQSSAFQTIKDEMNKNNWQTAWFIPHFNVKFIDGVKYAPSFYLNEKAVTFNPELADVIVERSQGSTREITLKDKKTGMVVTSFKY